jgi:hypothetical protein
MLVNIKKILEEEGEVRKFSGVAPEGFVLVHEKTLESLKDFDTWKMWKHNQITIKDLNKTNFDNS